MDGAKWLRGELIESRAVSAKAAQKKLKRQSGFPGGKAEVGHAVAYEMRLRGYPRTAAALAAHLAAVSGPWNFQGNRRLAYWIGVSERSIRRARALLEADGWIKSNLLLPGDMVLGQRAPVVRPQVVRDVSKLQRLASVRTAMRAPHKRSAEPRKPSAAETPAAPMTDAELQAIAAKAPSWLQGSINGQDAAKAKRDKKPIPQPTDEELDALDAELRRLTELGLMRRTDPDPRPPPD